MKKFLFTIVAILVVVNLFSQDIIVTTDAKKIEAKILEVSKSEIRYKEIDNIDGPTFVLSTSEISSVIYSNGKVTVYNVESVKNEKSDEVSTPQQNTLVITQPDDNAALIELTTGEILNVLISNMSNSSVSYTQNGVPGTLPASQIATVKFANGQIKTYNKTTINSTQNVMAQKMPMRSMISRSGNSYFYEGRKMRGSEYAHFLEYNCIEAYEQYNHGDHIAAIGWSFLSVGLSLDLAAYICRIAVDSDGFSNPAIMTTSLLGLTFEIACIPTLCVGYVKKHNSAEVFNSSCVNKSKPQAYWSINASQNGIGLALNF